ncbi:putative F-box protein At5g52610 [Salvia miltiorrhiza]|uniref:putative F-box protein At5g52610 n=1 Tax=Salvia miltiorrhiza TaxID=226208 RepID=UPI0025ACB603|nr:putative F-box protein At5g52610 [Salvia miltiorrhiza]
MTLLEPPIQVNLYLMEHGANAIPNLLACGRALGIVGIMNDCFVAGFIMFIMVLGGKLLYLLRFTPPPRSTHFTGNRKAQMLPTKPTPPRRCFTDDSVSDPHSDILSRESINIVSLPTDLLFEILLRLPADHLYQRARLVCRRWCHIIHSHAFINAQMHGATYGLLLSPLKDYTLPLYVTADADGGIHTSELNHISKLRFLATCNGLALEYDFKDYRVRLVNPATKQSLLVPRLARGVSYFVLEYGFAYSAASSAYKVIARYTVCHSPQTDYGLDVLTVGVNESWRHIEVPHHLSPFFFNKVLVKKWK